MHEEVGLFVFRGKRAAIVRIQIAVIYVNAFLPCAAVFSCFHTTGCEAYSTTDEYAGIFNVCTHFMSSVGDKKKKNNQKSQNMSFLVPN